MTSLFTSHPRTWQHNRYVYPVISRRSRGLSVGINLNPDKACNFDCAYCSVDRSVAGGPRAVDLTVLRDELDAMLRLAISGGLWEQDPFTATPPALRRLNDVAFSGDGEPTAAAEFAAACAVATALLDFHGLDEVRTVVITNATLLHQAAVGAGLAALGDRAEVWAKLDAGSADYYRLVDRSDVPFERVLANLRRAGLERPLVLQCLFARCHGEAPPTAEIAAWAGRLRDLLAAGCTIRQVQVYTTARQTTEAWITALTRDELEPIAEAARALGLTVEVYP
jgi:wyosine [tRNA(Phe)-imidazoG37] synthetase (radical SAM superfamily)